MDDSLRLQALSHKIPRAPARMGQPTGLTEKHAKPEMAEARTEGTTYLRTAELREIVSTAPIVSETDVSRVANAIEDGLYSIDPRKIAERLVELELRLLYSTNNGT